MIRLERLHVLRGSLCARTRARAFTVRRNALRHAHAHTLCCTLSAECVGAFYARIFLREWATVSLVYTFLLFFLIFLSFLFVASASRQNRLGLLLAEDDVT